MDVLVAEGLSVEVGVITELGIESDVNVTDVPVAGSVPEIEPEDADDDDVPGSREETLLVVMPVAKVELESDSDDITDVAGSVLEIEPEDADDDDVPGSGEETLLVVMTKVGLVSPESPITRIQTHIISRFLKFGWGEYSMAYENLQTRL
jgi:hypothetical protein